MNIKKLKSLMELRGTKKKELAEVAGVSPAFVTYILNGYKIPSVPVLKRIADYFNVSVDELI